LLYAVTALASFRVAVSSGHENWLAPIVGGITGLITAATGVFVIPAVPYLQAIGLAKGGVGSGARLVVHGFYTGVGNESHLGRCAQGIHCGSIDRRARHGLRGHVAWQQLRQRMQPPTFRLWFFIGLLLLGAYLIGRSVM
jgi:uncharacterized membrane protein YfcA